MHYYIYVQFWASGEQEEARSSCEQRIFWGPGTDFKNLKLLIFFTCNPLDTYIIYFCRVSYRL